MTLKVWAKKYPDINWLSPIEWFRLGGIANLATSDAGFSHRGADWFWKVSTKKRFIDQIETYNSNIRYVPLNSFSINDNSNDSNFSKSFDDFIDDFNSHWAVAHK